MKRTFYDQETDIEWETFENHEDEEYLDIINQLDTWTSDKDIQNFIYPTALGSTLHYFCKKDPMKLFFAKSQGKLVAVIALSVRNHIFDEDKLRNYILNKNTTNYDEQFKIENEEFLEFEDTFSILKNSGKSSLFIDYIVTNPNNRKRGLGTKIIFSIKNNFRFFSSRDIQLIQADIDNENIASRKAFLKNNFKKMQPCRKSIPFSAYYCNLINKTEGQTHEKL